MQLLLLFFQHSGNPPLYATLIYVLYNTSTRVMYPFFVPKLCQKSGSFSEPFGSECELICSIHALRSTYSRQKTQKKPPRTNSRWLQKVGVTRFELATPWSQTRCSSQTEPHPEALSSSDSYTILNLPLHVNSIFNLFLKIFGPLLLFTQNLRCI